MLKKIKLKNDFIFILAAAMRFPNVTKLPGGKSHCSYCDKVFSSLRAGKEHSARIHEAPEYIECSLCKKVLNNRHYFRVHINNIHNLRGKDLVGTYGKLIGTLTNV